MQGLLDKGLSLGFDLIVNIVVAILVYFVGKKLIKWVLKLLNKSLEKAKVETMVIKFTVSIAKVVLYSLLIVGIVAILGIPTTTFVTLFGTVSLTVGLALQGSLSNFAGGVLLLIFKPFHVGDYIVVSGNEGTVVGIDIFYTKLATIDNKIVIIPNGTLANSSLTNVTNEEYRRLDVQVGISYEADIQKSREVLLMVIAQDERIITDKDIKVFVAGLDASQVTMESRVWVKSEDYWPVKWNLLEKYKLALDEAGIEIPFNQLSVTLKGQQQ